MRLPFADNSFYAVTMSFGLRNVADEPFTLLTIWPQPAVRGANGIHDMRLDTWGTGFKLRQGCELVKDDEAMKVIQPGAGWDPEVEGW